MITQSSIDLIFDTARIDEVVGDFVTLKKRGVNMIGLCPFHNEKTPSFTVSPAKGIYKCFGCGAGGNSVKFVMEHEKQTYPEALKFLARKYNLDIEETEPAPEEKEHNNERESQYIVSSFAQEFFSETLMNSQEGIAIGLSYFKERGYTKETILQFQLGYSPDEKDSFTKAAMQNQYDIKYLEKTGLTIVKEHNKIDRFRGRVIFPIHNLSGRVIGFGGRVLKKEAQAAKYVNSPESEIYEKRKALYGIFFSKKAIIAENNCCLVEGYTDVISLWQAGVKNVVASSGTSLTEDQIMLIKRFTNNVTILFDGDQAGIKASLRGIDLILEEGMNVKVVTFPEGEDPDSFSKKINPEDLKAWLKDNAKDFISFKTGLMLQEAGNDPIKKASLVRNIINSVAVIPDAITRSVYVQECSKTLGVTEQALLNELNQIRRKRFDDARKQANRNEEQVFAGTEIRKTGEPLQPDEDMNILNEENNSEYQERDVIRLLLTLGNEKLQGDKQDETISVAKYLITEIETDGIVFENELYRKIFNEFVSAMKKDRIPEHSYFINHTQSEVSEMAITLLFSEYSLSANWEKHRIYVQTEDMLLKQSVERAVYSLKMTKLKHVARDMHQRMKEVEGEEREGLMIKYRQLLDDNKAIAKQLGRVIFLLIFVSAIALFGSPAFSQKIKVSGSNENIGGGNNYAYTVMIYQVKSSDVEKEWKSLIKEYAPVKLSSKKEIFADDCRIASISENTIDVYAKAEDEKDNIVKLTVAFDLGGTYLTSQHSGYKTGEKIVYDFALKMAVMGVNNELQDAQKELAKKEKILEKLKKENDNLHKNIERYNNQIEDAKNDIDKANNAIEINLKDQENGKTDIENQKEAVKKVSDKLNNFK